MPKNVKCKNCNNLNRVSHWCERVIDSPDEDIIRDCRHFCQKTNGDHIRAMNDAEIARFLSKLSVVAARISAPSYLTLTQQAALHEQEYISWMKYLQQPAKEDT